MCWVSKHSVTHHKPRYYLVASWTSWEQRRWTVIEQFPQYRAVAERPKLLVQFPDWKRSHVRRTSQQAQNGASGSVFISTPRHVAGANTRKSLPIYNLWTICFRRSLPSHFYVLEDFFSPKTYVLLKDWWGLAQGFFYPSAFSQNSIPLEPRSWTLTRWQIYQHLPLASHSPRV